MESSFFSMNSGKSPFFGFSHEISVTIYIILNPFFPYEILGKRHEIFIFPMKFPVLSLNPPSLSAPLGRLHVLGGRAESRSVPHALATERAWAPAQRMSGVF